jgi:heptaprenyl diphosphate synthase
MTPTREDSLIAGYAALAIAIHVLEAAVPTPLPGVKPGLANVVTLIALLRHGWHTAVWVSALRVLAGSLLVGTFLTPAFWLSAGGAAASLAALGAGALWNRLPQGARLSALGLAVLSALAHMAGQFAVAYALFIPHPGLLRLLPVLMLAALAFGLLTGAATRQVLTRLSAAPA